MKNMKTIFVLFLIFCLVFTNFVLVNVSSELEEDPLVHGWSKDVRLTNKSSADRCGADVATDSNGNVHLVLFDTDDYGVYYRRSADGGHEWSPKIKIASRCGAPIIATSQEDAIFIVYPMEVEGGASFDIHYSKSLDHGETWNGSIRITSTSDFSTCPDIYISGSTIHLVWNEYVNSTQMDIYYKRSDDLGEHWAEDRRVTKTSHGSYYPKIVADSKGTIHIIWQENTGTVSSEVWYSRSINGNMWETQKLVPQSSSYTEPEIVVDSLNNLHVVWTDYRCSYMNGEIFYKKSTNGGDIWSDDMNITKHSYDTDSWMPYLAIDSNDNIHLVWSGTNRTENSHDIYYKMISDYGDALGQTNRLTHAINGSRMHPRITMDKDNFAHLVWYDDRDDAPYYNKCEIYYKRTLNPVTEPPIIVTQFLNQTACEPGDSITVSGNAVYNGSAVSNANVSIKILGTGDEWNTTTDSNGDYSKIISAPDTAGNYTIRVTITWDNITSGNHTGWKMMRLIVEQESTNGGTTNGGTTNGGQQPSGGEDGQWINLKYVIGIVGVIAVCIIIGLVLVKCRGKSAVKTVKEKVEKPTITLRCPKCRKTFKVELKPKPFNVKCPYCGKEGEIK